MISWTASSGPPSPAATSSGPSPPGWCGTASRIKRNSQARHPHEVLRALADQGHEWAVVQSVHLLCGHEFYRLIDEVQTQPIRTSIGLPLLSSREDYLRLARALGLPGDLPPGEALVLVGHGTDHPAWAAYPALESILRQVYGPQIFVGVVEGSPSREEVVRAVTAAGVVKVRLIPLMLVAGTHFIEDLCDGEDSWQAAFTGAGLEVTVTPRGIGLQRGRGGHFHRPHPGGPGHHPGLGPGGHRACGP